MKIVAAKMPVAAKRRNAIRKNANAAMRLAAWQSAATTAAAAIITKIVTILGITIAIIIGMVVAIEKKQAVRKNKACFPRKEACLIFLLVV